MIFVVEDEAHFWSVAGTTVTSNFSTLEENHLWESIPCSFYISLLLFALFFTHPVP
jgi:hypothetical protein